MTNEDCVGAKPCQTNDGAVCSGGICEYQSVDQGMPCDREAEPPGSLQGVCNQGACSILRDQWLSIDGDGTNGLNHDPTFHGDEAHPAVFAGKLYSTWREINSPYDQIRVVVYNGVDHAPSWTFVDGNGTNGINHSATPVDADHSSLVAANGKLYAIWEESNGSRQQIRVAVYNGNDVAPSWTFVDGDGANGINQDAANEADVPQLVSFHGTLYATWNEYSPSYANIRVKIYNGDDASPLWMSVDGNGTTGLNKDPNQHAERARPIVFNGKLYLLWHENNGTKDQIRARVYNGDDWAPVWAFVDGNGTDGVNKNPSQDARSVRPFVYNAKLYVTWIEFDGSVFQVRVAVYNGNDSSPSWSFVDGNGPSGINKDVTKNAESSPDMLVHHGNLYVSWREVGGLNTYQVRLARYGGNDASPSWTLVDGDGVNGLNHDPARDATFWTDMVDCNNKIYLFWQESNGIADQIRARVYAP